MHVTAVCAVLIHPTAHQSRNHGLYQGRILVWNCEGKTKLERDMITVAICEQKWNVNRQTQWSMVYSGESKGGNICLLIAVRTINVLYRFARIEQTRVGHRRCRRKTSWNSAANELKCLLKKPWFLISSTGNSNLITGPIYALVLFIHFR